MGNLKIFVAFFCAVICTLSFSFSSFAADVDVGAWNTDSTLYEVLNYSAESNSAVEYAFLRVKYDRPSNRIKLLFMLELSSFTDESNAGVTMSVNGDEKITLHLNGFSEYNKDKYFAEIKSISDPRTKTLYLEVTLGIKQGIPDSVVLDFNIHDTEGVASNTYSVDISETHEEPDTTSQTEKTSKTKEIKATKATKAATEKSTKAKTSPQETVTEQSDEETQVTLNTEKHNSSETRVNEKKIIAAIAAVALAASCIGAGGIHFFRNKKN